MSEQKKPAGNYNTGESNRQTFSLGFVSLIGFGGLLLHSTIIAIFDKVSGILLGKSCMGLFCGFF